MFKQLLKENRALRSMTSLFVVGLVGSIITVLLFHFEAARTGIGDSSLGSNRFIDPLIPIFTGGSALTLLVTFLYGITQLVNEQQRTIRQWLVLLLVLTFIVAYGLVFFGFNIGNK